MGATKRQLECRLLNIDHGPLIQEVHRAADINIIRMLNAQYRSSMINSRSA